MSIVSQNIKYLRRMNGLTQDQFARRIGIKRSLVGAYEEARANPPLDKLKTIANNFNISVDALIKQDIRKVRETPDMSIAFDRAGNPQQSKDLTTEFLNKIQPSTQVPTPKPSVFENQGNYVQPVQQQVQQHQEPPKKEEVKLTELPERQANNQFYIVGLHLQVPYINNFENSNFFANQEKFSLPHISGAKLRGFELGNDFPIRNSIVIGDLFANINQVIDGKSYILVTKSSGIIYRRVYNQLKLKNKLLLSSDVPNILSQEISENDILEMWEVKGYYTTELPKPNPTFERLEKLVKDAANELERLKST